MSQITTLDNGLRVITQEMKESESLTIEVWADVGSRYENENQGGLSHFLEHMAFKGTSTRTARQIAEEFDSIGGHLNAHTSREHTVYYAKVLKDDFETAADLLSDILLNSTFDAKEMELERGVILQEIAMTNDTPDDIIFDHYQNAAFANQPVGRSILGTEELVRSYSRDDIESYMKSHYCAKNLVLSVAGNIEHAKVVDFAQKTLSGVRTGEKSKKAAAVYTSGVYTEEKDLEQVHLIMGFQGLAYHDDDIYVQQMLSCVFGGGMSSRLFQEVREKRGLAYSVSSFGSAYSDNGMFNIYSATNPEKVNELIGAVSDEIKKASDNITQEELGRAKAQARASILMSRESTTSRADSLGRRLSCYNKYVEDQKILDRINKVTTDDMSAMLCKITSSTKPTFTALGKLKNLDSYANIAKKLSI